jgi:hypothetical protein
MHRFSCQGQTALLRRRGLTAWRLRYLGAAGDAVALRTHEQRRRGARERMSHPVIALLCGRTRDRRVTGLSYLVVNKPDPVQFNVRFLAGYLGNG